MAKMKRLFSILMVALLLLPTVLVAEEMTYLTLTGKDKDYTTTVNAISLPVKENPVVSGENPLTGEAWSGTYSPIMTTVDTHPGAYPLWGISSADLFYEMPIQKDGSTRGLALYMGEIPAGSGPIRSARIAAASLREIWDAPFVYQGMRESKLTSVKDWWKEYRAEFWSSGRFQYPLVDLIQPRYNDTNERVADGHQAPHNVQVNLQAVLNSGKYESTPRPFLFSDEGFTSGAEVKSITIPYKETNPAYVPSYVYSEEEGVYYRYNNGELCLDGINNREVRVANVIVLRTSITWKGNPGAVIELVGQGTCEIFSNGRYQRGTWVRASSKKAKEDDSIAERMVFLDENGEELTLKRGKTFISIVDNLQEVNITAEGNVSIEGASAGKAPKATPTPAPTRTPRPTRTPKPDSGEAADVDVQEGEEGDVEFGN